MEFVYFVNFPMVGVGLGCNVSHFLLFFIHSSFDSRWNNSTQVYGGGKTKNNYVSVKLLQREAMWRGGGGRQRNEAACGLQFTPQKRPLRALPAVFRSILCRYLPNFTQSNDLTASLVKLARSLANSTPHLNPFEFSWLTNLKDRSTTVWVFINYIIASWGDLS